jgi:hypothetical protein
VEESLESAKSVTFKLLTAFLTLAILAFLAVFMYGMFYFTFVPSPEHEGQVRCYKIGLENTYTYINIHI